VALKPSAADVDVFRRHRLAEGLRSVVLKRQVCLLRSRVGR
jgi:hypothetical protein